MAYFAVIANFAAEMDFRRFQKIQKKSTNEQIEIVEN